MLNDPIELRWCGCGGHHLLITHDDDEDDDGLLYSFVITTVACGCGHYIRTLFQCDSGNW